MVNNRGYIIHKANIRKDRDTTMMLYKKNHPITPKQVVNVIDLGYLGIEKDFQNNYRHCRIKRKETNKRYPKKKKSITKFIPKRG